MFFHKITRLASASNLNEYIENNLKESVSKTTIIPLISPATTVGKYLLSPNDSAVLSAYSDEVNIIYLHQDSTASFEEFAKKIIEITEEKLGVKPRSNSILLFVAQNNSMFILDNIDSNDSKEFESLIFDIIDAVESEDYEKINNIRVRLKVTEFSNRYGSSITSILKFVLGLFL